VLYYTGVDAFSKQEVYVARNLRDRKLQRALLQFFKPDNYFEVRQALEPAGRTDLIGGGCDALVPAQPRPTHPAPAWLSPRCPAPSWRPARLLSGSSFVDEEALTTGNTCRRRPEGWAAP
jgi:hypothetical protein